MYSTLRPPRSTLFPYTTLFRSQRARARPASRSYTDEVLFECRGVSVDEGRRVLLARARHQKGRLGQPVARAEGGEAEARGREGFREPLKRLPAHGLGPVDGLRPTAQVEGRALHRARPVDAKVVGEVRRSEERRV